VTDIAAFLKEKNTAARLSDHKRTGSSFVDVSLKKMSRLIHGAYLQWESSSTRGYFQDMDARIKTAFLLVFIITASISRNPVSLLAICVLCVLLAVFSKTGFTRYLLKVIATAFLFGFLPALPATLNLITPGDPVFQIARPGIEYTLWIYRIPADISVTRQGIEILGLLTLRVASSVSVAFLVLSVTPFPELVRSLKFLRVPDAFLLILFMAYRHILLFALSIREFYLALKSRMIGPVENSRAREIVAGRIAIVFRRSMIRADEVYTAMSARGFAGTVEMPGFARFSGSDLAALGFIILSAFVIYFLPEMP